ncbi:MAG TPA: hypothetical protein VGE50_04520 [Gammaproteobacteria bacterium]
MRFIGVAIISLLQIACSDATVEEFTFRKVLEHDLINLCGDDDEACIHAVESQVKGCMEKSDWRKYVESQDDPDELKRFTKEFYGCVVDANGHPYFVPNL